MKTYLEHLKLLELKTEKRKKKRLEKSSVNAKMTLDYDWVGMLNYGTLSKQTGAVLDKYIQYHHLKTHPLKKDKLIEVQRHIISNLANSATQQEQFDSDEDSVEATLSSEDEDVLAEIDSSSSEDE